MKTKIALIHPGIFQRIYPGNTPLRYLSHALKVAGFVVDWWDFDVHGGVKKFTAWLRQFNPDIVGITAMSIQINDAMEICRIVKKVLPNCLTILGGTHATEAGDYLYPFHSHHLDAFVKGPALKTMVEVAMAIEDGKWNSRRGEVPGVHFWDGQAVHKPPLPYGIADDPNELIPDLDVWDHYYDFWVFNGLKTWQLMTMTGCRSHCFFCHSSTAARGGSAEDGRRIVLHRQLPRMDLAVFEQICNEASRRGFQTLCHDSDTFTDDHEYALELAKIAARYFKYQMCLTRPDRLPGNIIHQFATLGFTEIFCGMESWVDGVMLALGKTNDLTRYKESYVNAFRVMKDVNLPATTSLILAGNPKLVAGDGYVPDTIEDAIVSIEAALELSPTYFSPNALRLLPGVPHSMGKKFSFLWPVECDELHGGYWENEFLKAHGLKDLRSWHPIFSAYEGVGSLLSKHATPEVCYQILAESVKRINAKNKGSRPGRDRVQLVVEPQFQKKFMKKRDGQYELASFEEISKWRVRKTALIERS